MIRRERAIALAVLGSLAVAATQPAAAIAATTRTKPAATTASATDVREVMRRLTTEDGAPGAVLEVRYDRGATTFTSGVADVTTGAPMPGTGSFRIGSMTKPFVATVVLQLVAERRVALDAHVERYLPGVVRGNGNDGRRITVRELLQHTSGLPDYVDYLDPREVLKNPTAHHDVRDLLKLALDHPPTFKPRRGWSYSNTGYLLAGMIIERVTGNTYAEEIRRRIIVPLGLRDTLVPGDATTIPGPHARGYVRPAPTAPLTDLTELNPSIANASGEMVSTTADLDRFLGALVRGRLLPPAELRQMMRTRSTDSADGRAYGLGLESRPLPCGGLYWGHSGDIFGFKTTGGATTSGRTATVMANLDPGGTKAQSADMRTAVETALCN
ncbi:class A beta-lactamase-related serine hydrolase [Actinomadura logoneensis]|uniref:Class A beta-lactamase-related serine hydrolase n=1 Tax=Actinomadura logoneensis TaxID=2293572 RepID=A0A372JMV6_9ACTN|nr:serine hydrolase domain-containing protein [Actinomadura logoneensis]RFU41342.1 class A beta-lactamase-related serine hydrolase [Actinomadura logoneensis]